MKLYGALASPFVARVVLFARLKGLALEPQMPEGGLKSPAFLALNPLGKMPTLVDGDFVLIESEVICEYLQDLHPGGDGLAGDAHARARARLLSRIMDLYLTPHGNTLVRQMNPATRDAAAVDAAGKALSTGLGQLEHFMTADPFAAGPTLSLADCTLLPAFALMRKTSFAVAGLADPTSGEGRIAHWWANIGANPRAGAFLTEYEAAVDAFLRMFAPGR